MDVIDRINDSVATHKVDEFYAWFDFKSAMRELKRDGNEFLDGMDDFAADLDTGLDLLDGLADIDCGADEIELSRYELRRQEWQ